MQRFLMLGTCFIAPLWLSGCNDSTSDAVTDVENAVEEVEQAVDDVKESEAGQALEQISAQSPVNVSLMTNHIVNNDAAYIPSQCYTKTRGEMGQVHNPCFSCHTQGVTPNYIDDSAFQMEYDFREYSRTNRWRNLFRDRTEQVDAISDQAILDYVKTSNYFDEQGNITLAQTLENVPSNWDYNQNGNWDGYKPDCYFNFDEQGFDVDPNNHDTGWRAFAYSPFLGTFWPTNGSTDDVIIRLPESMRQTQQGQYSREVYQINLAIVEAMVKRESVSIPTVDESLYGVDLNRNGLVDQAQEVVYDWAPNEGRFMSYVGLAKTLQEQGELKLAGGLYPKGTEFLHTVRYLDVDENDEIGLSDRVKELRYAKKESWNNYAQLYNAAMGEELEVAQFPDRLRTITGNAEEGVANGLGWVYQGFIEDAQGQLRPQNFEESMTCIGCHSGVGVTVDSGYSFQRRLGGETFQNGWYHWTQKGLEGIKEPKYEDGTYQYTEYLINNQSANEFRNNDEVVNKFFNDQGELKQVEVDKLHQDISHLLIPSVERALELNKAYKVIVEEQSYIYGRDPHVKPIETVWEVVPLDETTGVDEPIIRN
ncbi:hypothetical protein [Thiomicrospira sp. WB1]|uniref:hypothetical protein n=1 Tax=Thiomicrospira sp. WB1 TaxID=1685380 RepID=UPI00074844EB|nr:hypothetical protein [Thiomicrospira sp. WB1]KUJ72426.1 hypothetical protein AVO41_01005 [Thiomicrospira sp. WB1]